MQKKSALKRLRLSFTAFWLVTSAFYGLLFVGLEFAGSPFAGIRGFFGVFLQWFAVSVTASALIGLMAVCRYVFAVAFPLLMVASSVALYFKLTMGAQISPTAIELAMVTDSAIWQTVISWLLVLMAIAAAALGAFAAYVRFACVRALPRRRYIWLAAFAAGVWVPYNCIARIHRTLTEHMPFSFWYSYAEYAENHEEMLTERHAFDKVSATTDADSLNVILIIGESLRPDHLSINGYARKTTPSLDADSGVVSFADMHSELTYTHVSVPRIVSRGDSLNPRLAYSEPSFLTLFKKAGYRSAWISNQDMCRTYIYFMHEADTLCQVNVGRNDYYNDLWLDTELLPALDDFLGGSSPRKVAVMHTIGSHWWYPAHYTRSQARWTPEVDSRIVSEMSRAQIVNSYDNTILASDSFWKAVIDRLRGSRSIVIFISDHGESLGEDGRWIHSADAPEVRSTACFVWYSPKYASFYLQKVAALRANAHRRVSTDYIFHTVLDAGAITTPVLDRGRSLLAK